MPFIQEETAEASDWLPFHVMSLVGSIGSGGGAGTELVSKVSKVYLYIYIFTPPRAAVTFLKEWTTPLKLLYVIKLIITEFRIW